MQFIMDNLAVILTALLAISEVLALIPGIKSNSVFTFIVNVIKMLMPKESKPELAEKKD